jgi:hypothetical protein
VLGRGCRREGLLPQVALHGVTRSSVMQKAPAETNLTCEFAGGGEGI